MKGQSSVGNRIIWAFFMVVLCTFLTFFMSMFLGSAFPEMNFIYKAGIPVLVYVVLGVASFGLQGYLIPFISELSIPEGLKKAIPFILIGVGVFLGQLSYDEFATNVQQTEVFKNFMLNGQIYDTTKLGIESVYQSGLDVVRIFLGNTVFALSVYNRFYLILTAFFIYFAIKNICNQKSFAANLFLVLFFCSKHTMELAVKPEATLVYVTLVAVFFLCVSIVYYFRTRTHNLIAQVISVFVMDSLFAVLFLVEANSMILALPAILVSFSGKNKQDKRWYYILAVEGIMLILITGVVVLISNPNILLEFSFDFPVIDAIDMKSTSILVLNVIGFLGVYGMWNQKLYYVIPALMGIYFMFAKAEFGSGVHSEYLQFLSFALFASLGVGLLDNLEEDEEEIDYLDDDLDDESVLKAQQVPVAQPVKDAPVVNKEEQKEIADIKALNEKLNKAQAGFVPLTFKGPKAREKKTFDFDYEPTIEQMKYDVAVSDDDDFDI